MQSKILVIEDAHALRRDIMEMLQYEGFDVHGAENGRIGIQAVMDFQPDLIICDIMMPEVDGFGVLRELQKDPMLATIPFVFLTAKTDKSDMRMGMSLGANDYLTKPFTAQELISMVQTQLRKRVNVQLLADKRLNQLRDNIILALPHELRTPLTGIMGFSDLLAMDAQSMTPDAVGEMARYIHNAAMRLFRLTENYLAYAQLEAMVGDARRAQSLQKFVSNEPGFFIEGPASQRAQHYKRESDLQVTIDPNVCIHILEDHLKKLVEELVDNAFKFSGKGTPVQVSGQMNGAWYVLSVTDRGRGFDLENVQSIGAYSQFGRELHEQQGAGLGLAIVQRILQLHKGEMSILRNPDGGSKVIIRLPLSKAANDG